MSLDSVLCDVTSAILVSQNNETGAILVSQTSSVGFEHFFFCQDFLLYQLMYKAAGHVGEKALYTD